MNLSNSILVIGADTPLGSEIANKVSSANTGVISWSCDRVVNDSTKIIKDSLYSKKPFAVVNCLGLSYRCAHAGDQAHIQSLAATHTAIQYAGRKGAVYVHASSADVYGQAVSMSQRTVYEPYDPYLCSTDNLESLFNSRLESQVFMQTQIACPDVWAGARVSTGLVFYVLRLGPIVLPAGNSNKDACKLSKFVHLALSKRHKDVHIESPEALVTPVSLDYAVNSVMYAVDNPHKLQSGVYNIGSNNPVSLRSLFNQLNIYSGSHFVVKPKNIRYSDKDDSLLVNWPVVDQALSNVWWHRRTKLSPLNTTTLIKSVLSDEDSDAELF
jgi:nucleoside-diphosphate-sugar epimerase